MSPLMTTDCHFFSFRYSISLTLIYGLGGYCGAVDKKSGVGTNFSTDCRAGTVVAMT